MFLVFFCIKAVLNLKTKSLGIILTSAMFVPISTFLLFLVSELVCGEEHVFLAFLAYFLRFFASFARIKFISPKLKCTHHPCTNATFVPNLTFLGLLSHEMSFVEKTVTHPGIHPGPH